MTPRGRLLTADEVRAKFFADERNRPTVSARWVFQHVTPRVNIARGVVRYFEQDVVEWLESRRSAA